MDDPLLIPGLYDLKQVISRFRARLPTNIRNDYEYVDYALSVLRETKKISGNIVHNMLEKAPMPLVKSNEISENIRIQGNEFYKAGVIHNAWLYYSRSISYAETGSEQLALAYGNRSAFFFQYKLFKECLEDIERALENNYPKKKVFKLTQRRAQATELLDTQKSASYYGQIPKIKNKNAQIPGASNNIKIEKNDEFGRHIVANREINPGEILLIEKPYFSFPCAESTDYFLHCSECLQLCYNLIPCEKCIDAVYCSKLCRRKAFVDYHRYECVTLRYFGYNQINRMAIRMTLKGAKEYGLTGNNGEYKKYSELFSGKVQVDSIEIIIHILAAAKAFYVLKNNTDFFSEFDINDKENVLKGMLFHDSKVCICNCMAIKKWCSDEMRTIGRGLYPTVSFFNHACYENVMTFFYGNTVVVKAKRRIKQGEQCFINYGVSPAQMKIERQQILKTQYQFICKCQACVQNWPLTSEKMSNRAKALFTQLVRIYHECTSVEIDRQKKDALLQITFNIAQKLENEMPYSVNKLTTGIFNCILSDGNSMNDFKLFDPRLSDMEQLITFISTTFMSSLLTFSV